MARPDAALVGASAGLTDRDASGALVQCCVSFCDKSPMACSEKTSGAPASGELTRKLAWGLFDQAAVSATGFFSTVLVGRFCGADQLGVYSLGLSIVYLTLNAQDALVSSPYTIYASRLEPEDRKRYAGSTLIQSCLIALPAALLLIFVAMAGHAGIGPVWLAGWSWSLMLLVPVSLWRQLGRKMAFADQRAHRAALFDALVMVLQLAGFAGLATTGLLNVPFAYSAAALACLATSILWFNVSSRSIALKHSRFSSDFARNWSLGKWVLASRLVSVVNACAIPWMFLLLISDVRATGIFAACISVVSVSNLILFGLGNVLEPRMAAAWAERGLAGVRQVEQRTTLLLSGVMAMFFLALFLIGDKIMQFLYQGPEYADQSHIILVLAAAAFIDSVGIGASQAMRVVEQARANLRANVIGLVATLAVAAVAIPNSALLGGAYALLVGNLVTTAVRYRAYWRCMYSDLAATNPADPYSPPLECPN